MTGVARKGDTSDHGLGGINDGAVVSSVVVNGQFIAIGGGSDTQAGAENDDLYVPSPENNGVPIHPQGCGTGPDPIAVPGPITGSPNVFAGANATPVHRLGDRRGCGAETNVGSLNVFANEPGTLIAPGATVEDPIEGPLSPVNFSYPISEMIMFAGSNIIYTRSDEWEFIQGIEDLSEYGTSLVPELIGGAGTGTLDIDRARKSPASDSVPDDSNSETVLGGIIIRGFPSFGNISADQVGIIQGTPTQSNLSFHFIEEEIGTPPTIYYRPNIQPTSMTVENESGSASLDLSIVVLPGPEILPFIR